MKQYILTLISILLLTSCSLIEDNLAPCAAMDEDTVTLSFQMLTNPSYPGSRTDDKGHDEVNSEFSQFEDRIDVSDISLFVFAKVTGETDSEGNPTPEKLVVKTNDFLGDPAGAIESSGSYIVTFKIARNEFNDALGIAEVPNSNVNLSFRVVMFANCNIGSVDWSKIDGSTYAEVLNQINHPDIWSIGMSHLYENNGSDDVTELYGKNAVPMFGSSTFVVSQKDLFFSRPNQRVYLGEIEMLRSLAKVRVVDNIQKKDALGFPKVINATFVGTQSSVKPLPFDALNYKNGTQVHTPNIFDPNIALSTTNEVEYRLGLIPDRWIEPAVNKTGAVRIGFVPEQAIGNSNGNVNTGFPIFRVKVAYSDDEIISYDVPMTAYKDQLFNFGEYILRNHIYTLSVDIMGEDLNCIVDLLPYTAVTLEPNFGF